MITKYVCQSPMNLKFLTENHKPLFLFLKFFKSVYPVLIQLSSHVF